MGGVGGLPKSAPAQTEYVPMPLDFLFGSVPPPQQAQVKRGFHKRVGAGGGPFVHICVVYVVCERELFIQRHSEGGRLYMCDITHSYMRCNQFISTT